MNFLTMLCLTFKAFNKISTSVLFACVLFSGCAVCKADVLLKPSGFRQTSYFGVLDDVSNTLNYIGDESNVNSLKNISVNALHVFNKINNFIFNEDDEKSRDVKKIITSLDLQQRNRIKNLIKKQHVNIPPDILASLKDFEAIGEKQEIPSTCINDTGRILTGLLNKEPWAIQFFDATGKPGSSITQFRVNFVGNYDQCRAAIATPRPEDKDRKDGGRFTGKYGTLVAKIKSIPLEAKLGVCMPDTCSDAEITILFYQMVGLQKKIPLQYAYFIDQTVRTEMTPAAKAAISILSIIGFLVVTGTLYDLLVVQRPKWAETKTKTRLVTNMNSVDIPKGNDHLISHTEIDKMAANGEKTPLLPSATPKKEGQINPSSEPNSILAQVFLSFSVYSNSKKILNTNQPPGSLGAIHGIRFLSMSWVVLCHIFAFSTSYALDYVTAFIKFYNRWSFVPISNGFVSVDTFFTLSGLLTSYLTIKEMMRRNTWKINWPLFYFHRFWRLTPPYMFALVIVLGLTQFMGQGPMWSNQQPYDRKNCEKNWWTNLLYVNNLVNFKEGCFGHSWYLANDMQFFVLSPLMMIPFFFHRLAGFFSCFVFLLTSWITTGVLSHDRKWPTTTSSLKPVPGRADAGAWMEDYYIVPWCRIGPFIVGVMAGYVLAMTKGRQFKMPKWVVISGWIISLATGLAVVYGLYGDIKGDNPSTLGAAAFYNAVNRSAWGACVCWVIIACSAGYGGPVNSLLSWSPFVVLGRLTYMSYLIHLCIVYTFYENLDSPFSFNDTTIVVYFLGLLVFVNMSAFIGVLVLESPMLGLEKTFIKRGKAN